MSCIDRYGKPSAGFPAERALGVTSEEDAVQLRNAKTIEKIYGSQPIRAGCKLCGEAFSEPLFSRRGIAYFLCGRCGHLTGAYEDTPAFHEALYAGEDSPQAQDYKDVDKEAFRRRVCDVYRPKADFLAGELGVRDSAGNPRPVADIGAGAGHMVAALAEAGFDPIGYELNDASIRRANAMIGREAVYPMPTADIDALANTIDRPVVTAIFVLEHLADPVGIMRRLADNPAVEHLLVAVPLFGFGPMSDELFRSVRPRVIAFGHTHLFTHESLDWICRATGWRARARWWFGGDAMDLIRAAGLSFSRDPDTRSLAGQWVTRMIPLVDDLQLVLDKHGLSSEVHMLLEKAPPSGDARADEKTIR